MAYEAKVLSLIEGGVALGHVESRHNIRLYTAEHIRLMSEQTARYSDSRKLSMFIEMEVLLNSAIMVYNHLKKVPPSEDIMGRIQAHLVRIIQKWLMVYYGFHDYIVYVFPAEVEYAAMIKIAAEVLGAARASKLKVLTAVLAKAALRLGRDNLLLAATLADEAGSSLAALLPVMYSVTADGYSTLAIATPVTPIPKNPLSSGKLMLDLHQQLRPASIPGYLWIRHWARGN